MAFRTAPQRDPLAPRRAALYLRVSTGRQAAGDVSIPSQRDLTRRFCEAQGWVVTAEFVEPGASATDDRRPAFQRMLDEATGADRRFDIICIHAFSRFYRNGAEMELTIRKLRKHGVEVVSVTQPTGDDPSQEMMRQIIGIFDEYPSRENGKNVTRAMRESAKQGFWNGTTPPLGYRIVAAERRVPRPRSDSKSTRSKPSSSAWSFGYMQREMADLDRSGSRKRPRGSMRTAIGLAGAQPSASVPFTAFSRAVTTRPENGRMDAETPGPAACMIPAPSSRSKSRRSSRLS
jgi:DNA invertase Pin-like site-specific DNA recombinase